jgi:hypothetical protein
MNACFAPQSSFVVHAPGEDEVAFSQGHGVHATAGNLQHLRLAAARQCSESEAGWEPRQPLRWDAVK